MSFFDMFNFGGGDDMPSYDSGPSLLDGASDAAPATGFFGDFSYGDISDTLGIAFGNALTGDSSGMPEWITGSSAFNSLSSGGANPVKESGTSLLDKVGGFVDKNKTFTELALKGFGGAVASKNAKAAAKAGSRSRIEELEAADRLRQQENARYSASVSGLRSPGLVGKQMALKRIDGTPIYQNGRIA